MVTEIKAESVAARITAIFSIATLSVVLTYSGLANFIVGVLTDPRADVSKEMLAAGATHFPNSAALNARLANAEMLEDDRDLADVQKYATRAANISPWDYRNRLLLATVREATGDREAAERILQEAATLAPNYPEVHWRLANLLLREGKLARSVAEFRTATSSNSALLPSTLDLLFRVSGGNIVPLQAVTPGDPKSKLALAQFLLKQSRSADAVTIFSGIDRSRLAGLSETAAFINSLIAAGRIVEARGLWVGLVSGLYAQPGRDLPVIWNGGFETDISTNMSQFDWVLSRNDYAIPSIDSITAHTGGRSLRIDFTGRDTTRLDGQVKQTIVPRPGQRYRLECYVKTENLDSPEGPRIVVADASSSAEIAASEPIPTGSSDWRRIEVDFKAPENAKALYITIRRVPKFSYDKPTKGTLRFDDFSLSEQGK